MMSKSGVASLRFDDEMQTESRCSLAKLVLLGLAALGAMLVLTTEALRWPWRINVLGSTLVLLSALVWLLLHHSHLFAMWLLVLGCMATNLLALLWLPSSVSLCLLALPAGLAVLLINGYAGLAIAVLSSLIIMKGAAFLPTLEDSFRIPYLLVTWGVTILMWASSRLSRQAAEASWIRYSRMGQLLEEARDQRVELKQTQEDLVVANRELARLSQRLARLPLDRGAPWGV